MIRPNILFVITDQMRSTALGCKGIEKVLTPNLDRFAAQGTRFANAISNTPACTPARATLLTGKHVLTHGLVTNDMQLGQNHRTIAHCLGEEGYRCAYIGKWHLDGVNRGAYIPPGARRQGFDDFWAGTECNHDYFNGYYYNDANSEPVWFDGYEPAGQTDLAIDYVEHAAHRHNPFCLFLSWSPPHCPYNQAPKEYLNLYPEKNIDLLPNAMDSDVQDSKTLWRRVRRADLPDEQRDSIKRKTIAGYYAHITALDAQFGRLLSCLDRKKIAKNTIVVFASDHGDMLFSHNRGWKSKPWRESVGIPLLIRWPGRIPAARVTRGPIGLVDLMPTLLGLLGLRIPDEIEGCDLSSFVLGDESAAQESEYISFPCMAAWFRDPTWRGVITRSHTYVRIREGPWLLYDDVNDPFQMRNLLDDSSQMRLLNHLETILRDWLKKTGDDFPPAKEIADRFCGYHIDNNIPVPPLDSRIAVRQSRSQSSDR